jgi:hypothetical protein
VRGLTGGVWIGRRRIDEDLILDGMERMINSTAVEEQQLVT